MVPWLFSPPQGPVIAPLTHRWLWLLWHFTPSSDYHSSEYCTVGLHLPNCYYLRIQFHRDSAHPGFALFLRQSPYCLIFPGCRKSQELFPDLFPGLGCMLFPEPYRHCFIHALLHCTLFRVLCQQIFSGSRKISGRKCTVSLNQAQVYHKLESTD